MCLIVYSPEAKAVEPYVLAFANAQNEDGIGVMSREGINKFLGRKMLKRAMAHVRDLVRDNVPYAIHFRWATHGIISKDNTHPYQMNDGRHWVMHNGVIGETAKLATGDQSDTAIFVEQFMPDVVNFHDEEYWRALGNMIGFGNKFVVMNAAGEFALANEDAGIWIDGVWFSNTYSLPDAKIPGRKWRHSEEADAAPRWDGGAYTWVKQHDGAWRKEYGYGSQTAHFSEVDYEGNRKYASRFAYADRQGKYVEGSYPPATVEALREARGEEAYQEWLERKYRQERGWYDEGTAGAGTAAEAVAVCDAEGYEVSAFDPDVGERAAVAAIGYDGPQEQPIGGDFAPQEDGEVTAEDGEAYDDNRFKQELRKLARWVNV